MTGILWTPEEKEREWAFAKEKLIVDDKLLPNGSKLSRKDYPKNLNHSFIVIDGRILALSGQGLYLGSGAYAHTKLAEDEDGNLFALKIITKDGFWSNSSRESNIASDLGIAGQKITRESSSKRHSTKHYIAYKYLGSSLLNYINNQALSLDKCYELSIKVALALHDIHTGKNTKSQKSYHHNDIHWGNIVIDSQEEPHFIDYGRAKDGNGPNIEDVIQMLLLFFTPKTNRDHRHPNWIFGDWLGEYDFYYDKPKFSEKHQQYMAKKHCIYIYSDPNDQKIDGSYSVVRYLVKDINGICREGAVNLDGLQLSKLPYTGTDGDEITWDCSLNMDDLLIIKNKVQEAATVNGHIVNQSSRNLVLFNLLKDPMTFSYTLDFPTAFDIAEILTLCRLQLETFKIAFENRDENSRLKTVHILNSISPQLLALYEKLNALTEATNGLNEIIKKYIVTWLIDFPKNKKIDVTESFNLELKKLSEDNKLLIKKNIDDIIMVINIAKESQQAKNNANLSKQSNLKNKSPDDIESEVNKGINEAAKMIRNLK